MGDLISLFLDTTFLVAYYNERETNLARVVELLKNIETKQFGASYISDYIFDETITLLKKYLGNKRATDKGIGILKSNELLKVDSQVFADAWNLSKKFDGLSFTDCTNVALMKHYNIDFIATYDSGFDGIVKILQ